MRFVERLKVFWQSLFIQANWNYERMQNIGFLTALLPALPHVTRDSREQRRIAGRHLEYFNTQPYFASFIIGNTISQERSRLEYGLPGEEEIKKAKINMMGPFAALGDSLFWATLKPFAGLVAVFLVLVYQMKTAPLVFLILYNVPHLFTRWWGLKKGYEQQFGVIQSVFNLRCQTLIKILKMMGLIILGGSLPVFAARVGWSIPEYVNYHLLLLIFTVITLFLSLLLRRGVSPMWLLITLFLGCVLIF